MGQINTMARDVALGEGTPSQVKDLIEKRSIPSWFLYDDEGTEQFHQICFTKDYYLTRTEDAMVRAYADTLVTFRGDQQLEQVNVIEFGCGLSVKTKAILDAAVAKYDVVQYVGMDVSEDAIVRAMEALAQAYPTVRLSSYVGTYDMFLEAMKKTVLPGRNIYLFLGYVCLGPRPSCHGGRHALSLDVLAPLRWHRCCCGGGGGGVAGEVRVLCMLCRLSRVQVIHRQLYHK